jgi:hypothetical protein
MQARTPDVTSTPPRRSVTGSEREQGSDIGHDLDRSRQSCRILDFRIDLPNGARVTVQPHHDRAEIQVSTSPDSVTVRFADVPDVDGSVA